MSPSLETMPAVPWGGGDAPGRCQGSGWAGNDAQGWKKLPFPPAGGRKVRDGVWLQRAEPGPGALLAK